jgi:hypothetical protein
MCSIVLDEVARDVPACPPRPLELVEREICELAAHIAAATCRWLLLVAEFDERRGWAEWGVWSCAHWLSWRCGIATRSAREHVRVGRALTNLPLVREAFAAGELSYSKVRAITRVADEKTEASLLEMARHATGAQLERLVRSYAGALAATVDQARQTVDQRRLTYYWEDDGSLTIQARLPAEDGAAVLAALRAAEHQRPAEADEELPSPAARRADALAAVARAALEDGLGASTAPDGALITVHVDAQTLAGDEVHERSELADGPALAPEVVRRLGCDGSVVRILERDGQPLSVGRRTRVISPALRRALHSRDGGCRFPGCEHRRFLHAHHIQHWARGGPTTLSNLVQLCSHHHRLVHEGGFAVQSSAGDGIVFRRPDGRSIPTVPRVRRATGPGLEQRHRRQGLAIDARTCAPRSAGDRLDYDIAVDALITRALRYGSPP